MTEPSLLDRQRRLLRDLARAAAERARGEPAVTTGFRVGMERIEKEAAETAAAAGRRLADEEAAAQAELRGTKAALLRRYQDEAESANKQAAGEREAFTKRHAAARQAAHDAFKEVRWTIGAVLEGALSDAKDRARQGRLQVETAAESLAALQKEARALLEEWQQPAAEMEDEVRAALDPEAEKTYRPLEEYVTEAQELLDRLGMLVAPRYLSWPRLAGLLAILFVAQVYPLGWLIVHLLRPSASTSLLVALGMIASGLVTVGVGRVTYGILRAFARSQVRDLYIPFCRLMLEADFAREKALADLKEEFLQRKRAAKQHHNDELRKAHARYRRTMIALKREKEGALPPLEEQMLRRLAAGEERRGAELRAAEERAAARLDQARARHAEEVRQCEELRQQRVQELRATLTRDWTALAGAWQQMMNQLRRTVSEVNQQVQALYPPWTSDYWQQWSPPEAPPEVVRFGTFQLRLEHLPNTWPGEERLRAMTPPVLDLPALTAFPSRPSLLLEAGEEGRGEAVAVLQAALFRLLTSLPAGKARCVIIDPVGLGQNFAAFMHLADYDEALVASRIWTEAAHIEQRLADLTAHMENVIQKYLRNVFTDISEYNQHAGEVAEPFRILVVANFPVNFGTEAMRRLSSIVQSGPRCGVYTLVSVDTRQPLPKGFEISDLRPAGVHLVHKDGRFVWQDADFAPHPLEVDAPPPDALANTLLERVGEAARNAQRVMVPFEFITAPPEQWWQSDSRNGVRVALGRAGATARQYLDLGKGTSQHVLVAGKTGAGKSTLLHAMITNLALLYSPDEIELYLVDFKKGVEFKTYATHALPHARVVAIESEREFGLSVLQRLDAELRARGERFRAAGAQDLPGYRAARPDAVIPRILLIVDEFQEFFTEDDRIAQESAQLLDRLVRQGRAFGMHVLLGSQTLGGAYSLARSTIDQMAVRIALQCSEADAHLILSDDNSAARLLSRPGEAIYNDANGLIEGNHPFQVVWLDDGRREEYLARVHQLARQRPPRSGMAPVVFEGNAPADVTRNHRLRQLLGGAVSADGRGGVAWLGDALAINDMTAVPFRRQNGSNLMIVGQHDEASLGMLVMSALSLAAHGARAGDQQPRFFIVDGRQAEGASGVLGRLPEVLPCPVKLAGWREVGQVVAEVLAEVESRQKTPDAPAGPIYLILHGLQRMRDLRRAEDDFGFSRGDAPLTPPQQLGNVLREGPSLGVHTLLWCDTFTNLQRSLDRAGLREVGLRVVLQMGVADSSNLIESPAASKLGMHRALFFSEEDGRLEKFRPYGVPPDAWLDEVQKQLRQAARLPEPAGKGA
jgi:hypothetical protein